MKLADMTWQEVDALDRKVVVLIPTGSLEQHGPHLPLFTDSILVSYIADQIDLTIGKAVLVTPTIWLGASAHHLAFSGSLSASMTGYLDALDSVIDSLCRHGFGNFMVINGHGGNTELNGVCLRNLKQRYPERSFCHSNYFAFGESAVSSVLSGPIKGIRHACEAETSMMLAIRPDLVRTDRMQDDGLSPSPAITGLVTTFDEITARGNLGYSSLGTAEKGKAILSACVEGAVRQVEALATGYVFQALPAATGEGTGESS